MLQIKSEITFDTLFTLLSVTTIDDDIETIE